MVFVVYMLKEKHSWKARSARRNTSKKQDQQGSAQPAGNKKIGKNSETSKDIGKDSRRHIAQRKTH